MQYVILSNGKRTRWNNYMGITKQEIVINGENLLQRIVRQIKNSDETAKIIISSSNPNHEVTGCIRYSSKNTNKDKKMYLYEKINEPIIFLYGDTYYENNIIDIIVNSFTDKVLFFGNENAIIAIKVIDYQLFKNKLDVYKGDKRLLHEFEEYDIDRLFINVGYNFKNINTSDDYHELLKIKKLIKANKR